MLKTCVIIPTYNEGNSIASLVRKIREQGLDVIVIDDGSCDNTSGIAADNGAIVLRNLNNEGKGACLIKGFRYALKNSFEAVITMDGDGQHSPSEIPYFISSAADINADVIIGNRMSQRKNMPWVRVLTNKLMSVLISSIVKQNIPDTQCGFRLIKKQVLEGINLETSKYEIESEIIVKARRLGFQIVSVPIKTIYLGQKSRINPVRDTLRFIKFISKELWCQKNLFSKINA